jgi:pimeloyl-ACP methyl ester carboxylesterase
MRLRRRREHRPVTERHTLAAQLAAVRTLYKLQQITLGGHTWFYLDTGVNHGGRLPLVLLPGAMGAADTSFQYILAFAAERRVVSLDYPRTLAALSPLVEGLENVLAALEIGRAAVVGGSYSGLVAQYYAAACPQDVAALLLANTGPPARAESRRWQFAAAAIAPMPQPLLHAAMRAGMYRFLQGASPEQEFWRAYFAREIPTLRKDAMLARLRLTAAMHAGALECYGCAFGGPTLIVNAEGDRLVPPHQRAAMCALYPHAQCVTLGEQGHVASLDAAEKYIDLYKDFLCRTMAHG